MALFATRLQPLYLSYNQAVARAMPPEPSSAVPISWPWSPETVQQWLVETGFGRYRRCFKEHGINGQMLISLNPQQLRSLGIIDRDDALGIWSNAMMLGSQYCHIESGKLPEMPRNYNRAICFGEETHLPKHRMAPLMSYTADLSPGSTTLRRIWSLAGDRIPLIPSDTPFEFKRLQFPMRLAFTMSINKTQGQSLKIAGIYLSSDCFSHGQLYVAMSRVGSENHLYVLPNNGKPMNVVIVCN